MMAVTPRNESVRRMWARSRLRPAFKSMAVTAQSRPAMSESTEALERSIGTGNLPARFRLLGLLPLLFFILHANVGKDVEQSGNKRSGAPAKD